MFLREALFELLFGLLLELKYVFFDFCADLRDELFVVLAQVLARANTVQVPVFVGTGGVQFAERHRV